MLSSVAAAFAVVVGVFAIAYVAWMIATAVSLLVEWAKKKAPQRRKH